MNFGLITPSGSYVSKIYYIIYYIKKIRFSGALEVLYESLLVYLSVVVFCCRFFPVLVESVLERVQRLCFSNFRRELVPHPCVSEVEGVCLNTVDTVSRGSLHQLKFMRSCESLPRLECSGESFFGVNCEMLIQLNHSATFTSMKKCCLTPKTLKSILRPKKMIFMKNKLYH